MDNYLNAVNSSLQYTNKLLFEIVFSLSVNYRYVQYAFFAFGNWCGGKYIPLLCFCRMTICFCFEIFDGNSDLVTVVSHKLQNPIITRYIRINPLRFHGGVALRADFYGCKTGKYLVFLRIPVLEVLFSFPMD